MQTEYDGLGRVTKVCNIGSTTSTGSGTACSQNTGSANGATDAYTYSQGTRYTSVSIQRGGSGGQQRSQKFDALGRVTQKVTPEGGTWAYTYDTNTSCPSGYRGVNGSLASISDPNSNLLCYAYDSLNRVIGVNANGTTCRHFYYDNSTGYSGSIPSGVSTPTNPYGRIVEAATDSCSSGTLITDEWFSYDEDGRVTDMWELTPHSGQYYHSTATFYANGVVNTLQLASPSLYALTWGLDGEGRWDTLADGSTNLVTGPTTPGTMFDAAGHTLNVKLTGTTPDQDIYTYDSNTGRMKTFEFEVGNTPANLTGTLTWNANGTLGQLQIADGFNSGGSGTCYSNSSSALGYGYDDWARLAVFDCGSGNWGQQFSFDIDDNLSKTVLSGRTGTTWNPGYSATNNHCTGCTYDSDGNVTGDGNYVYGWNEFSKLKWATTSGTPTCGTSGRCTIYDAFGRIVEQSNGTAWKERWITQVGDTVNMAGTTPNFALWPSPGGGTVVINGTTGFGYMHKDWIGDARVVSSISNHTVTRDQGYTPYGEQYYSFGSAGSQYDMFADLTDNFYFGAMWDTPNRELSMVGRWLSPDPAGSGWNQYAYPTNPNSFADPSGLYAKIPSTINTNPINPYMPGDLDQPHCSVDGLDEPCNMAMQELIDGAAIQCPNNDCSVFRSYTGSNGKIYDYVAGVNGPVWIAPNGEELDNPPTEVGLGFAFDYSLGAANTRDRPFWTGAVLLRNLSGAKGIPGTCISKGKIGGAGGIMVCDFEVVASCTNQPMFSTNIVTDAPPGYSAWWSAYWCAFPGTAFQLCRPVPGSAVKTTNPGPEYCPNPY